MKERNIDKLKRDIVRLLAEQGPMSSRSIAAALNPRYNGGLSSQTVAHVCKQLESVRFNQEYPGGPSWWEVCA